MKKIICGGNVWKIMAFMAIMCMGDTALGDIAVLEFGPETFERFSAIYNTSWIILFSTMLIHTLFVLKNSISCKTAFARETARVEQVLYLLFFLFMIFLWRFSLVDGMIRNYNAMQNGYNGYYLKKEFVIFSGHLKSNFLNTFPPHLFLAAFFLPAGGLCSGVWRCQSQIDKSKNCAAPKTYRKWFKILGTVFFLICSLGLLCVDSRDGMWVQGARTVGCGHDGSERGSWKK